MDGGSPAATSSLAATWPLVGRDAELTRIAEAMGDEDCRGVVVSAGAGVGKSRLAREAHAAAQRSGALAVWAQATRSSATVPLGAFAGLIPDDVRSDDALELMRCSADALRTQAGGRKVVLGVDDAQLLDPVSAALLLHLTTTQSVFVVATVRSGEPCPDAVVSLWKDAGARRLELDRLGDAAVAALVEGALGGPVEQAALRWVAESSQGNALYVHELVLGAVDAGTLALEHGLWRLARRPSVSPSLVELVATRMGTLSDDERAPVELLALGEPLRLDELIALTSADAVIDAEAHGMVLVDAPATGGDVRLSHPLYGEVVRSALPVLRARGLRLRLAAAVQERDPLSPDDALRVARWLLDAGAAIPPELLLDAARAALLAGDPDLGAELAERAVADGAGLPATLVLARAHTVRKRFEDTEAVLAAAQDLVASLAGDPAAHDTVLDSLEQRMHALYWGLGRAADARALLSGARAWSDDPLWERRLLPLRLALTGMLDGFSGTVDLLADLLADPDLDAATRRMAEPRYAIALFYLGRSSEVHPLARRLRPSVPLGDYNDAVALGAWSLTSIESGQDWEDAEAYMRDTLRDAVDVNDRDAGGIAAYSLGVLAFLGGRHADARRWFAEADVHFERQDTFGAAVQMRAFEVGLGLATGDARAALAAHDRMTSALDGREPANSQRPYVLRADGWAARARGEDAAAVDMLLAAASHLDDQPGYASLLTYEAMRAGAPAADVASAQARLAARCDARLVAAYAAHAAALAAGDADALLAVAEELAALGAMPYAVDAAAQAAAALVRAGRHDAARRAAVRMRELHVPGQGTQPPEIEGLDAAASTLTSRESEIVTLAAGGLSNAEIADRLVLSVRTVESHIYRAMHKLGVSDRRHL